MSEPLYVGLDIGTSGTRAIAIRDDGGIAGQGSAIMADFGADHREPSAWIKAAHAALTELCETIDVNAIASISVDGTSGTMLAIDEAGSPVAPPLMYNDPVPDPSVIERIAYVASPASAARGSNSALGRLICLQDAPTSLHVIHQADWIAGHLSGRFNVSDENNALKTGYDPVTRCWPDWIDKTGARMSVLPAIVKPGTVTARASGPLAHSLGLSPDAYVVAGTTDGCASFLATGASKPGDGVTALGTTLTIKMLTDAPISAPQFGIYSHRVPGGWLAGGASNTGGNVIAAHFDADRVATLSNQFDPQSDTGLTYYPLTKPGERFPVADPEFQPRMMPRPDEDAIFLQAILEGIADIEAQGYHRLGELGAPSLVSMRTVGGGAKNMAWTALRQRRLDVPFKTTLSEQAAYGTALLACQGAHSA